MRINLLAQCLIIKESLKPLAVITVTVNISVVDMIT